ncbi:hypothetical protein PFICI_08047 [Pestalotiopsis fici W106-1]|uniref:Uncharacterized protein n=1 Tax=Pestalotiopsis fici (strain W106-1 / CGMCC3.15140) TaxID=1229662 RepID=W3X2Z4_PESFW|nr:uncharacterized protein PFICI_08047 [Pestalotiopsis fici W106-1]ETS80518.1 hypothetical protein PFICI_08047 [Pestalotiopsis fici W106-1]
MARNRGNRSRQNNRRGRSEEGNSVRDSWSARGGHTSTNHDSKFGRGRQHDRQNNYHQNRRHHLHQHHAYRPGQQAWNWQQGLSSEENDTTDSSDLDTSDADMVSLNQFPPAENNVFSLLLPPASRSAAAATNSTFRCLRGDCARIKKNLDWIKRRDRRLRRMIRLALEQLGPHLYDFLLDSDEEGGGHDEDVEDDSDSMDWTPEPTVHLVVNATSTPSLEFSPHERTGEHTGLGIIWNTTPYQAHFPPEQPPEQQPSPLGASQQLYHHQQQQQQHSNMNMAGRPSPQMRQQPQSPYHPQYQQQPQPLEHELLHQQQQTYRQHAPAVDCVSRMHAYRSDAHV